MSTFQTRSEVEAAGFEPYTGQPVAVGDTVVVYARGGWRSAPVTKVTPKYVFADVTTPTSPDLHTVGRGDRTGRMADLYVTTRTREVPGFFARPPLAAMCAEHPFRPASPIDPDHIRCAACIVAEGASAEFTPAEVAAAMVECGMDPTDAVGQPRVQMPEWEQLPDRGTMSRDYIVRLPFVIETGKWGERADCIHRWYNHYEHSWVVSFALMTDFNDGRGETPAQVGPSQYVHSKDDSQREAEHLWKQALVSPRFSDPAPSEPIFTVGFSDETLAQMRADGVIPTEVEVEVDGETVVVDPEVADHIEQGWSVGESEDIADHDEGLHDEESVPGCPRCEDTYDEPEDDVLAEAQAIVDANDAIRSGESFKAVDDGEAVIFANVGPVVMGDLDTPTFQGPAFTVYLSGWVREGEWRHEVASETFVVRQASGGWLWSGETLPGVPDRNLMTGGRTPHEVAERIAVAWRQFALARRTGATEQAEAKLCPVYIEVALLMEPTEFDPPGEPGWTNLPIIGCSLPEGHAGDHRAEVDPPAVSK